MLLAGLYAVIFPAQALFILIWAGAILLLIDGVLGLWALTFGGAKTGNFWFDVIRNVLAIVTGFLILISPILGALIHGVVRGLSAGVPGDPRGRHGDRDRAARARALLQDLAGAGRRVCSTCCSAWRCCSRR